jgi:hypothetical protein
VTTHNAPTVPWVSSTKPVSRVGNGRALGHGQQTVRRERVERGAPLPPRGGLDVQRFGAWSSEARLGYMLRVVSGCPVSGTRPTRPLPLGRGWSYLPVSPSTLAPLGCLSRIGCLVVLAVGGVGAYWLYGDRLPSVLSRVASGAASQVTDVATQASERLDSSQGARIASENDAARRAERAKREQAIVWARVSPVGTAGREAVARLSRRNGPAYISLRAPELAGLLAASVPKVFPATASRPDIAIVDEQLLVRTVVELRDLAGDGALRGLLGVALDGRDTVRLTGTLDLERPGLAAFRVRELRMAGIDVPPRLIPSLLGAMRRAAAADSLPTDALPIPLPKVVADVRVASGKVTLYKAVVP